MEGSDCEEVPVDYVYELDFDVSNGDYEGNTDLDGKWMPGTYDEQIAKWNEVMEFLDIEKDARSISSPDLNDKEFVSIDQAETFYMLYAMQLGFSVRRKERRVNTKGLVVNRSWVCSNHGFKETKNVKNEKEEGTVGREVRGISRTGCMAKLKITLIKEVGIWVVHTFEASHNHRLAYSFEKPFLRSNRNIPHCSMELAMSIKRAGVKPFQIWNYQAHINDGWKNVGFTKKDLYNGLSKKLSTWAGEDTNTAICLLESRKGTDPKFFYKYEIDEDNRLTNLFWSDGSCQIDYRIFGDALFFDATYKTNRYNKPLVILLGVNNHDKSCVFGAALLQNETA
ncbi:FRS (FAR1 Related Sequences) transcription factor family [Euphorbia peplus]|nr:FRS (FAR1 Related Sequences) transcription factor family [Euphorbia peplus]